MDEIERAVLRSEGLDPDGPASNPDGTVWAEIVNPWQYNAAQGDSGVPVVQIDPSTPGRAWLNLSDALSHHGVTAFVEGR